VRLEAVNSTAIGVNWQAPLDRELNGVIRGYQIHYARTSHDDHMIVGPSSGSRGGIYDTMNGSVYAATIIGLHPETEYRVHITAYTRRGDGQPSRVRRVRTKGAGLFRVLYNHHVVFSQSTVIKGAFTLISSHLISS